MANGLQVTAVIKFLADQYADGRLENVEIDTSEMGTIDIYVDKLPSKKISEQDKKYFLEELRVREIFEPRDYLNGVPIITLDA